MRVFIDQGIQHPLTKRMMPYWAKLGMELTPIEQAQVHLSYVNFTVPSKLPKVLRLDGIYYNTAMPYMAENRGILAAYKQAQGVVFQSKYSKDFAEKWFGATTVPNKIIYNGGDPSWSDPLPTATAPIPHENWNIVICSNWRRWKRMEEMIYLIEELATFPRGDYKDWKLHVVGMGKGLNLDKRNYPFIRWMGDMSHDQMKALYRKMDVALHIAKRDWCPNVVLEFLSAGIPTIVSDKGGGAAEIVRKIDERLVVLDDDDPDPLAPVAQYSKEWCKLSEDFETNVQSKLQQVYKDWLPKRVVLPEDLTAKYAATQYYNFMREFI